MRSTARSTPTCKSAGRCDDVSGDVEQALRIRAKGEIRKRMRALRNSIPEAALARRSEQIASRVRSLSCVLSAGKLGLFAPMASNKEVDVRSLDAWGRELGKKVYYPSVDPNTGDCTLREAAPDALEDRGMRFL